MGDNELEELRAEIEKLKNRVSTLETADKFRAFNEVKLSDRLRRLEKIVLKEEIV